MQGICIIIPCYNEASRLDENSFQQFLLERKEFSICFADDGSTDDTIRILNKIQSEFRGRVFIVRSGLNVGKAEIIRKAINEMSAEKVFEYYGYFDADLSAPLEAAIPFVDFLVKNKEKQIVFGSRIDKPGTVIYKNYLRHIAGRIFSLIVNNYFKLTLYDTQCGAKVLRREIVPVIFAEPFVSRWLFDIEIILRLRKHFGEDNIFVEETALLYWANKKGSKITLKDLLRLPSELVTIKKKYF
ncbi:MAG: glycosyltransferase [Sphingobacteriales bacterium]|nr:glycosyltransferase [Sphingobacteriales bacterium]